MRSKALDITKGLGILFVVFGHNWLALTKDGELVRVIFSFHMPLFFFISGALLNIKTSTIDFVQIRFNSLLKPYFIVLFCVCTADIIGLFINNKDVSARELAIFAKVIYGTGGTIPWVPLWFLPHLFLISVISIIIIKSIEDFSEKYLPLISVLLLCIGFMFLSYFSKHGFSPFGYYIDSPMGLPWSLDLTPITSSYLLMGYFLSGQIRNFSFNPYFLMFSLVTFTALHISFDETIDFNKRIYSNLVMSTIQAYLGIYICLNLSYIFSKLKFLGKILAYIGSGSLFILIFHNFIQANSFKIAAEYFANEYTAGIFSFLISTSLPLAFLAATKKNEIMSTLLLPKAKHPVLRQAPEI